MSAKLRWHFVIDVTMLAIVCLIVAMAISMVRRPDKNTATAGRVVRSDTEKVRVRISNVAAWLGRPDAKVSIVEFADFLCPFCAKHAQTTLLALRDGPIRAGRVRYAFRQMPLVEIHPQAWAASEAAVCAERQGQFWPMHDLLFKQIKVSSTLEVATLAEVLHLDRRRFDACLRHEAQTAVHNQSQQARSLGIEATPTFFIGRAISGSDMMAYRKIQGALEYRMFETAIVDVDNLSVQELQR